MRPVNLHSGDYNTLCSWWAHYGHPYVPKDILPTTGLIIDGEAAGFLYTTNSKMAMLEWIVAAPDAHHRKPAIRAICESLEFLAKQLGFKATCGSVTNASMVKLSASLGYTLAKEKSTLAWKNLEI